VIALFEQQFGQIGAVLSGYAGDDRFAWLAVWLAHGLPSILVKEKRKKHSHPPGRISSAHSEAHFGSTIHLRHEADLVKRA
jgi:hypothetical protein